MTEFTQKLVDISSNYIPPNVLSTNDTNVNSEPRKPSECNAADAEALEFERYESLTSLTLL